MSKDVFKELALEEAAIQDELAEQSQYSDDVDEASTDIDTLSEVSDVMANSEDGLSDSSMQIAEIAVESLCKRLGLCKPKHISLESFDSKLSRKQRTVVATEDLKDVIKRALEALGKAIQVVVEFISRIATKVIEFFKRILGFNKNKAKEVADIAKENDVIIVDASELIRMDPETSDAAIEKFATNIQSDYFDVLFKEIQTMNQGIKNTSKVFTNATARAKEILKTKDEKVYNLSSDKLKVFGSHANLPTKFSLEQLLSYFDDKEYLATYSGDQYLHSFDAIYHKISSKIGDIDGLYVLFEQMLSNQKLKSKVDNKNGQTECCIDLVYFGDVAKIKFDKEIVKLSNTNEFEILKYSSYELVHDQANENHNGSVEISDLFDPKAAKLLEEAFTSYEKLVLYDTDFMQKLTNNTNKLNDLVKELEHKYNKSNVASDTDEAESLKYMVKFVQTWLSTHRAFVYVYSANHSKAIYSIGELLNRLKNEMILGKSHQFRAGDDFSKMKKNDTLVMD